MNITIKLPQEWEKEFKEDKFADFFDCLWMDLSNGSEGHVGEYELKTLAMLEESFAKAEISEDSTEKLGGEDVPKGFKLVDVLGYPHGCAFGTIYVPESIVKTGKNEVIEYVATNFDDIKFDKPYFDFGGTNYEFEDEINGCYNSVDRED